MNDSDKIRLMTAMGIFKNDPSIETCNGVPQERSVRAWLKRPGNRLISPDTDANDDYAVLEWMRSDPNTWKYQFKPELISFRLELYEPGDYARAALKVIPNE